MGRDFADGMDNLIIAENAFLHISNGTWTPARYDSRIHDLHYDV